ncbi:MAG: GNAT family N-acetyltransferase [Bacilli bacterium]|nr:GNAT family N-acetyltransferase [Bacilli bacterium]
MQVKQNQIILTDRLILRHFNENDLEALYALLRDEEVNVFLPWFPVNNMEEAFTFLKDRFLNEYDKGVLFRYAICLKGDNLPIGYVWVSHDESQDFGHALKKAYWHKGIALEASLAVIEQLENSGYTYITATHDIHNPRSGKVMKKLGMEYKYSYLEQWQPKNIPVTFRMYQLNLDGHNRTYMKYWNQYEHFIEEL